MKYLAAIYLVGIVITFGHIANTPLLTENQKPAVITIGSPLWPFYWSWWIFHK